AIAVAIGSPAAALAAPHPPVAAVVAPTPDHGPGQSGPAFAARDLPAAPVGTHAGPDTAGHAGPLVYQVRKGDYLGRIAERFGGTFGSATEIAHENHIKDPNLIDIGWKIRLPETAVDSGPHRHATGDIVSGTTHEMPSDGEPSPEAAPPPPTGPVTRA